MAVLVFALKWLQWEYLITDYSLDIYIGAIAVFFTLLGIWVATQLSKKKVQVMLPEKKQAGHVLNKGELKKLNLTAREYEVLQLIAQGHTNAEIADNLFLSLSTVKTHVSNIFVKMDVQNRTQALKKARDLNLCS